MPSFPVLCGAGARSHGFLHTKEELHHSRPSECQAWNTMPSARVVAIVTQTLSSLDFFMYSLLAACPRLFPASSGSDCTGLTTRLSRAHEILVGHKGLPNQEFSPVWEGEWRVGMAEPMGTGQWRCQEGSPTKNSLCLCDSLPFLLPFTQPFLLPTKKTHTWF